MFWLLIAHMCLLPLVMISFTKSPALASLVSFLAVEMFFALELVARELENSFGNDANGAHHYLNSLAISSTATSAIMHYVVGFE